MERFWENRVGFKKLKKKGGGMITNQDYLKNLVRELTKLPYETENAGLIKIQLPDIWNIFHFGDRI